MRKTYARIIIALLAALLLAAGCGSDDDADTPPTVEYKVMGGRLVWCSGGAEDMVVPGNASSIGNNAFSNCGSIGTLTIPASVTHIMRYTFSGVKVGKIIFGGTVGEWTDMAEQDGFGETLRGTPVICSDGEWKWTAPAVPVTPNDWQITDGVLIRYTGNAADVTVPGGVTAIAGGVFAGHTELEHISIPAGVTGIVSSAFVGSGITEIEYKGDLTAWGALVEAGGIADELAGITVTCTDGTWTPAHTHTWGEAYTNGGADGHYRTCTGCDERSPTVAHTYGGAPQADGDGGHCQTCTGCGAYSPTMAHEYAYTGSNADTHTMTCPTCNHTKTEAHAYGDAAYTDAGHTKTCSRCGHSETAQHTWGNTYTNGGTDGHYQTCMTADCNAHSATMEHTYGGETYTSAGGHYQFCTAASCGERSGFDPHTYGGTPHADGDGGHYQVCTLAGCEARSATEPHNYTYADSSSTTHTMTCTECDYAKTEAHAYGGETYTDAGHTKTCAGCGHAETAQHAWGTAYADGGTDGHYRTCTTAGCNAHSPAEAHQYGTTYTNDNNGKHHQTCSVCAATKTEAHTYGTTWTDAGNGYHKRACTACAATQSTAHTWGNETYTDEGHVKTCTACTATKTEEHTYSTTYTSSGKSGHYRTCTAAGCGHTESEAHAYAYTDNGDGSQQNNCTRCDYSVRARHAYDSDACKDCGYPKPVLEGGTIDDTGTLTAYTGSAAAVEIPYGVLEIGDFAFRDCTNFTSVTIPDTATWIRPGAFMGCTNLTAVTIPDSLAYIGQGVFRDCTSLTSVTIPGGNSLDQYLFYGCTSLTSVTISASVKYIYAFVFSGCTSLTTVNYGGTMAEWGQISVDSNSGLSGKTIICTDGTLTL